MAALGPAIPMGGLPLHTRSVGNLGFQVQQLGGVPESQSWALRIAGFGLTGAAMRRRRAQVAA